MSRIRKGAADNPAAILRHWREAVPNDRLAHLVKDATRVLNRALQERLAGHDVSFGHWVFLRILWEHDGLTQRELSGQAGVMEPTTHAALNAMEARGLIERRRQPGDKRNQHVFITPAGTKLKTKLVAHAVEVNQLAVRGLATADVTTARRVLLGIIENLAAVPSHAPPLISPLPSPTTSTPHGKPA
jgi:MarR family transcriptional regulator, organic hydroperoxide resistance regulator